MSSLGLKISPGERQQCHSCSRELQSGPSNLSQEITPNFFPTPRRSHPTWLPYVVGTETWESNALHPSSNSLHPSPFPRQLVALPHNSLHFFSKNVFSDRLICHTTSCIATQRVAPSFFFRVAFPSSNYMTCLRQPHTPFQGGSIVDISETLPPFPGQKSCTFAAPINTSTARREEVFQHIRIVFAFLFQHAPPFRADFAAV